MWYWWRIVKPTVILRCRAQFSSSIVDFATNTNVGKSHSYGSIYSFQTRPQYAACTFSILNRIDIPATIVAQLVVPRQVDFQYPQPDRYPCNSYAYTSTDVATAFQYPQPDRYPCNLFRQDSKQTSQATFSILNRIDIPATAGDRSALIEEWQLSISSTGSISLQRSDEYAIYLPGCSFQYPQPDRYPCNAVHKAWPCPRPLHFQYPQPDRYSCNCLFCCGGRTQ